MTDTAQKAEITDPGLPIDGAAHILSFADSSRVGAALLLADYSVEEEIRRLAQLARSAGNPRIQLVAMTRLRKIAMEALYLSGRLQKLTARGITESGATLTVEQTRLALAESRPLQLPLEKPNAQNAEQLALPDPAISSDSRREVVQITIDSPEVPVRVQVSHDEEQTCIHKPPATSGGDEPSGSNAESIGTRTPTRQGTPGPVEPASNEKEETRETPSRNDGEGSNQGGQGSTES